jgi:hypothetical protein
MPPLLPTRLIGTGALAVAEDEDDVEKGASEVEDDAEEEEEEDGPAEDIVLEKDDADPTSLGGLGVCKGRVQGLRGTWHLEFGLGLVPTR